jgi:predicted phosphoribosyltransferase
MVQPQRSFPGYFVRYTAGRELAQHLKHYAHRPDVVVLGLPRGGVPVATEIGHALGTPVDVFVVRKLGVPGHRECAMGAIASGGVRVLSTDVIRGLRIPASAIEAVIAEESRELNRRERAYRGDRPPLALKDRVVIVADDGLATGATMRAAVQAIRRAHPSRIIVAAPVGSRHACDELEQDADEVICPLTPEPFDAVGRWYLDFSDHTDAEICALLASPVPSPTKEDH